MKELERLFGGGEVEVGQNKAKYSHLILDAKQKGGGLCLTDLIRCYLVA